MKQLHFNFNGFHVTAKRLVKIITFNFAYAITLFPFVFYRTEYGKSNLMVRTEESIHIHQQMECGLVGLFFYFCLGLIYRSWLVGLPALFLFYLLYLTFFIFNMIKIRRKMKGISFRIRWNISYEKIPFEIEASNNCNSIVYLKNRKLFAWMRYF